MMPLLYVGGFFVLFADFHNNKRATLLRFLLRLALSIPIGFFLFPEITIISKAVLTIYTFAILSFLTYAVFDNFYSLGIFAFVMLLFNAFVAIFMRLSPFIVDHGTQFNILASISTFAVLTFFMLLNIDTSRQFGMDVLNIPGTTKRALIVILVVIIIIMMSLSFLPFILDAIETVLSAVRDFIVWLFSLFPATGDMANDYVPDGQEELPFMTGEEEPPSEPHIIFQILMWIVAGLSILLMVAMVIFGIVKIILFIFRLFKAKQHKVMTNTEVYTETIEKISAIRKKRSVRNLIKRARYSSLQTERERFIFIYNEYVRKAKKIKLTQDKFSDTPNEVLNEITQNTSDNKFPHPENLATAFNTAKYSNTDTGLTGADALKQRLL